MRYTLLVSLFFISLFPAPAEASIFGWLTGNTAPTPTASQVDYQKPENSQTVKLLQAAVNPDPNPTKGQSDLTVVSGEALLNETGPLGSLADISTDTPTSDQISIYTVRKGDTLPAIAKMFNVTVNTIRWANDISASGIKEGDVLTILPISGVQYVVKKGDTVASVAKKYKADKDEIIAFNELTSSSTLSEGDVLILPDAEIPTVVKPATPGLTRAQIAAHVNPLRGATNVPDYPGYYIRPIVGGVETQGLHGYNAVDLASPIGTTIRAAADGTVIVAKRSGYNGGYGNYVVILHDNGTQTLYGHMQTVVVSQGDTVSQGQKIGTIGITGKSTGPHVHFEIRGAKNPF